MSCLGCNLMEVEVVKFGDGFRCSTCPDLEVNNDRNISVVAASGNTNCAVDMDALPNWKRK